MFQFFTNLKTTTTGPTPPLYFFHRWFNIFIYKLELDNNKATIPLLPTNRQPMAAIGKLQSKMSSCANSAQLCSYAIRNQSWKLHYRWKLHGYFKKGTGRPTRPVQRAPNTSSSILSEAARSPLPPPRTAPQFMQLSYMAEIILLENKITRGLDFVVWTSFTSLHSTKLLIKGGGVLEKDII